jgi:hypothetical protein
LPSESRNSLGAYVESVPMVSLPADLMSAGTFAASAASTPPLPPLAEVAGAAPVPESPFVYDPQAAIEVASAAATARPRIARRPPEVRNIEYLLRTDESVMRRPGRRL